MDVIHENLKHDSISHNRGYSKSKTINLATKHHVNRNHKPKLNKHNKAMKIRVKSQKEKEKVRTWIDYNEWSI